MLPAGQGKPLKYFKLPIMDLQVKELQKADVKACCLLDEFNNKTQLVEGKYSM